MKSFKKFFEYYQGEKLLKFKVGNKDPNRLGFDKKHLTTQSKDYSHKNHHVNNLLKGSASQIKLMYLFRRIHFLLRSISLLISFYALISLWFFA